MIEETKNYIKEYFKSENHDFTSLLNVDATSEDKVIDIKKEISALMRQLEEKGNALNKEMEKLYSKKFTPISKTSIISYGGNMFDATTGLPIENYIDEENSIRYRVDKKSGEIEIVVGYDYELACIITKIYKYTIPTNNNKITLKPLKEKVISFLEDTISVVDLTTGRIDTSNNQNYYNSNFNSYVLRNVKDNEFINTLFNCEYKGQKSLKDLRENYNENKAFEIIIKTAPAEIVDDLLNERYENALPIHKLLGISQETYNKAIERNIIKYVYVARNIINGSMDEKHNIRKTESEWLDYIDDIKHYEEDLQFYDISYDTWNRTTLLETILEKYTGYSIFSEYYTLGKFTNYVINETINQGYTSISNFISELRDYLEMCKQDEIKPTLYSSYLKQTHDITSRNHNIKVEQENEEIFKERYKEFKPYFMGKYCVVAPKDTNDLKKEGDVLNHCVASYIKRVIDNECMIYFLRIDKNESLITFEVRNNRIVQVRGLHNRKPIKEEVDALTKFAEKRKMELAI